MPFSWVLVHASNGLLGFNIEPYIAMVGEGFFVLHMPFTEAHVPALATVMTSLRLMSPKVGLLPLLANYKLLAEI